MSTTNSRYVIAVRRTDAPLRDAVDAVLEELSRSLELARMFERWTGRALPADVPA